MRDVHQTLEENSYQNVYIKRSGKKKTVNKKRKSLYLLEKLSPESARENKFCTENC